MTHIYFLGAEVPGWRKLLTEEGVSHAGISFSGLVRRLPKTKHYTVAERFDPSLTLMLDSGGYAFNRAFLAGKTLPIDVEEYVSKYKTFILHNVERFALVTEFDFLGKGKEWIQQQREDFYSMLPSDKFMPVWHGEDNADLDYLCREYDNVGVLESSLRQGLNLAPLLNSMVQRYGTNLHGIAATKPDDLRNIKFTSVASTSWLSPMKYGDTIVWDNNRLRRYPVKYKDQARKKHRNLFTKAGFDAELIQADNPNEVARFTVWSWKQMEAHMDRKKPSNNPFRLASEDDLVDNLDEFDEEGFADSKGNVIDNPEKQTRNEIVVRPAEERMILPLVGFTTDEDGEKTAFVNSASLRQCNTCYISDKCPQFKQDTTCAFELPIEVKTKAQRRALVNGLVAMQTQRVMFMRMVEEAEGGYADPNMTNEMKVLGDLMKTQSDLEAEGFSLKMQISGREQGPGVLSQLFGEKKAALANPEPNPMEAYQTNKAIESVVDGEVL